MQDVQECLEHNYAQNCESLLPLRMLTRKRPSSTRAPPAQPTLTWRVAPAAAEAIVAVTQAVETGAVHTLVALRVRTVVCGGGRAVH